MRVVSKGIEEFQAERLTVPGFSAMPAIPAAWAGKVPDQAGVRDHLRAELKVLSIRDDCSLIIPRDSEVPVEINQKLQGLLAELRERFPEPTNATPEREPSKITTPEGPTKFNKLSELLNALHVHKTIKNANYDVLIVSPDREQFDEEDGGHSMWLHNPSDTARVDMDNYQDDLDDQFWFRGTGNDKAWAGPGSAGTGQH